MKHFKFLLLVSGLVGEACAQQPFVHAAIDPTAPAQRRADLRSVLKKLQGQEAQVENPEPASGPLARHLSAQERSALREQLRQQHRGAKLEQP